MLDKSKYKPDEREYQNQYLKNHLENDPRLLKDPNIQDPSHEVYIQNMQQVVQMGKNKAAELESQQPPVDPSPIKNSQSFDLGRIREFFQWMTEAEKNPNSQESMVFSQQMEELERRNPKKKSVQIIFKKVKKDRTDSKLED